MLQQELASLVGQLYLRKKTSTWTHSKKNRSDLWLPDVGGGERESDESSLNVQISATDK